MKMAQQEVASDSRIGTKVRLNSGSPELTVKAVNQEGQMTVVWEAEMTLPEACFTQ
jgi:hypothetical protein